MSLTGEELFTKAEGKINRILFNDHEAAYEYFIKAGGVFKSERNWLRAGDAFMRAGDMSMKLKNAGDAAQSYTESANAYKKVDISKAQSVMQQAIQLNLENNRLSGAAKLLKEWAEALELDGRSDDAVAAYTRARQYFEAEDQPQASNACTLKIAKLNVDLKKYVLAAKEYETVAFRYTEGPLKHQARESFFKAFLCRAALVKPDNATETVAAAREALSTYCVADLHFPRSREEEVCNLLLEALDESDEDKYQEALGIMHELRMIDDVKVSIMTDIGGSFSSTN